MATINKMQNVYFISQAYKTITHLDSIIRACEVGIKWIQLRIKDASAVEIEKIAKASRSICNYYKAKLIINDDPYLAKSIGADGIHVGKKDMPVAAVREFVGKKMLLGATANTFEDICIHYKNGANYIGLGPFQFTKTKENLSPVLGLQGYHKILHLCMKKGINIPVFAIGGIQMENITDLMQTGIYGIAISSLLVFSEDYKEKAAAIDKKISDYHQI